MPAIRNGRFIRTCFLLTAVSLLVLPARADDGPGRTSGKMFVTVRTCPDTLEQAKSLRDGQIRSGGFFCGKTRKAVPAGPWTCRETGNETAPEEEWEDEVIGECEESEIMTCTRNYACTTGRPSRSGRDSGKKKSRRGRQNSAENCDSLPDKLDKCERFTCSFRHPFAGKNMTRRILGIREGACIYTEEMPDGGEMRCSYDEKLRKNVARYMRKELSAKTSGTSVSLSISGGEPEVRQTLNGEETTDPRQEALDSGVCEISGYD
ncbi:MAG: hypothetical protein RQ748_11600 [Elusimicrobiales bacterium]|nr:hypothetical protein [Elusimicrobiales bacterium]